MSVKQINMDLGMFFMGCAEPVLPEKNTASHQETLHEPSVKSEREANDEHQCDAHHSHCR